MEGLTDKQREFLNSMALELEAGNSIWKQYAADEEKRQADAGIATIKLDADKARSTSIPPIASPGRLR